MNRYYPAFLDLEGKSVLVVGAGSIALQKLQALIPSRARLMVVAPEVSPAVASLARRGKIVLSRRAFRPADVKGRAVVFCATNNEALNARVSAECRRRRILANVVDRPKLCDFIVPAVLRRGEVVFAISTGGASPALAKLLRRRLEKTFGPEVSRAAADLKKSRKRLLRLPMRERIRVLESIVTDRALSELRRGNKDYLSDLLDRRLKTR